MSCSIRLPQRLIIGTFILLYSSASSQTQWTTPRQLNPAAGLQGNPYVAIGPNNEVAITCSEGSTPRVAVYVSTDRGATFARSIMPLPGEPYQTMAPLGIAYDRNGNLFVLWGWSRPEPIYVADLILSKSTDGGVTFSAFWRRVQPLVWLGETPFSIDRNNSIHIIWDSTISANRFTLLYSKFVNGSANNIITHTVPRPDTLPEGLKSASMLICADTIHFAAQQHGGDVSAGRYTRSVNAGATFSPYVLIDTLLKAPRLVRTTQGNAIFYGHHNDVVSIGSPMLRLISDSLGILGDPFRLRTRPISLDRFKGIVTRSGTNCVTYTAVEDRSGVCSYYQLGEVAGEPTDSTFFSPFNQTVFALDSLGGKYLIANHHTQYKLYIMTKDILNSVDSRSPLSSNQSNGIFVTLDAPTLTLHVRISLLTKATGRLAIYDILGREITTVYAGSFVAGQSDYKISPRRLSSGIYFAVLDTKTARLMAKFLVVQ